ncbi:nitronate monooxygenase [Mycolicibacterium sp.]|uniref:NAD(P)H-dependent flavin oxidoreductase n=1 Tax=Mycolicibacterium sp. TaxID=2320850 RepID=UPI001A2095B5|nr:nitronate monooxygenase [Mycolicibacterium sp.]MBJ7337416.1 nitronate monooxygenase [Mycolicibacterium sp.]
MTLRTALTELFGLDHPIVLAPMGGVAGGRLAAAVSEGGGLGMIGAGVGEPNWLTTECGLVRKHTDRPWGIGLVTWGVDAATIDRTIAQRPSAVMLSFGDPTPYADTVRAAGIILMVQVTSLDDAKRALDVGADVIVAQGAEAGGHGERRATLPFVPTVVDAAGKTPVLAAGGIADGRGLAAALMLGAAGAMIGTRFEATTEALLGADEVKAITAATADDTIRDRVLDIVVDSPWPARFTARTLRNRVTEAWHDREADLKTDADAKRAFRDGIARGDMDYVPVWAGEAVDLIPDVGDAADVLRRIGDDAARTIGTVWREHASQESRWDGS